MQRKKNMTSSEDLTGDSLLGSCFSQEMCGDLDDRQLMAIKRTTLTKNDRFME